MKKLILRWRQWRIERAYRHLTWDMDLGMYTYEEYLRKLGILNKQSKTLKNK